MRKTILFIAMSLDGYIAGRDGSVDWLRGQEPGQDDMSSYDAFIRGIDTVVMGWTTYHQIVTQLSPGQWAYGGMTSYVLTHRPLPSTEEIRFVREDTCALIRRLKREPGKDIWICGGAGVIQPLLRDALIDRFHLSVIPVILGDGIRLFQPMDTGIPLRSAAVRRYNGIVDLVYEPRAPHT